MLNTENMVREDRKKEWYEGILRHEELCHVLVWLSLNLFQIVVHVTGGPHQMWADCPERIIQQK